MESMRPLLQTIPNFRIIHLIRDPRAVTLSRSKDWSLRGIYTLLNQNDSLTREAQLYCQTLERDLEVRLELEREFPGKILQASYEELTADLLPYVERIYKFTGSNMNKNVASWLKNMVEIHKKVGAERLSRWRKAMTLQQSRDIVSVCRNILLLIRNSQWLLEVNDEAKWIVL